MFVAPSTVSLKEPSPGRFWYHKIHKEACIFLITHVKFYSWKLFRLEDINESVAGYGNHN